MTPKQLDLLNVGRRVISAESAALNVTERMLGDSFVRAVELILACRGKIIVSGMGKSGHVARKIAATMTSTGTPTLFLHPAEAAHGDMGIICSEDVVMVLSFSGQTDELRSVVEFARKQGNRLIAITSSSNSYLATSADVCLAIEIPDDGSSLGIVPTASAVVELALGDAIAMALAEARGFRAEDFAALHPGGYIERRVREVGNDDENL